MNPVLDLSSLKTLFSKGLDYAKKKEKGNWFYGQYDDLCNFQLSLANKATDLSSFMNALWLSNPILASAYDAPSAICQGCEILHNDVQFGVGNIEWYFYYGICGDYGYNLNFIKAEIAPPKIIEEMKIAPSEAVRWIVLGGFGPVGGNVWYSLPPEWLYLTYKKPTTSPPYNPSVIDKNDTFILQGSGDSVKKVILEVTGINANVDVSYIDQTGTQRSLMLQMMGQTSPSANFPNSCECGYGLGTLYYSNTNMIVSLSIDEGKTTLSGNGWFDHQLIKGGIPKGKYIQALSTVSNMLKPKKSTGWLWFAIQDYQDDIQYMLMHLFGTKTYVEDIKLNENIPMDIINVYHNGLVKFKPNDSIFSSDNLKVILLENKTVGPFNINLPSKYKITLPTGKEVILKLATAPNIYPVAHAPYETPAYLYDITETTQIGVGLIEANWYFDNSQLAMRLLQQAGGDVTNKSQLKLVLDGIEMPQTVWQKILGVIVVLMPLWVLLIVIWFVRCRKDGRSNRLILSLIIVLFLILMMK